MIVQIFGKSPVLKHYPFPVDSPPYWFFPSHPQCTVSEEVKEQWISTELYLYAAWNLLEEKEISVSWSPSLGRQLMPSCIENKIIYFTLYTLLKEYLTDQYNVQLFKPCWGDGYPSPRKEMPGGEGGSSVAVFDVEVAALQCKCASVTLQTPSALLSVLFAPCPPHVLCNNSFRCLRVLCSLFHVSEEQNGRCLAKLHSPLV